MKIIRNNSGISLIEVIAAVMVITIGMIGVLSLVIQNVQAQYINKNVLIASGLAQDGLELVRSVRDTNWLTSGASWNQDIVGDGTYAVDYSGRGSINMTPNAIGDAGTRLYINSDGFYTHTVTAEATNFYRLISVVDNGSYLDVKCYVRWADGTQNHNYTAETYLYNWR